MRNTVLLKKALYSAFFFISILINSHASEFESTTNPVCFSAINGSGRIDAWVDVVIDGDTFSLTDGRIVRVLGIEAPELNFQEPSYSENGAVDSLKVLQQLLPKNEPVQLFLDDKKQDRFGHILAYVFRKADQLDIGAHLLKFGWARQVIYPPNQQAWACYQALESVAQKNLDGIWKYFRYWPRITNFVSKKDAGYLRLQGEITSLHRMRRYLWLELDNKVWLGIRLDDLDYFPENFALKLLHNQVEVKGWLYYSHDKLRIRIRHPQQINLISNLSVAPAVF